MGDGAVGGRERTPEDRAGLLRRISGELLRWNPGAVRTTWIPSDETDVFEISTTDDSAPRIVKVERPGMWCVRREEQAFPVLRALGFWEFPEVEFSTASLDDPEAPFTVMPKADHRPWSEIWAEDPKQAIWVVERIGDFLRRLAAVDWREVPGVVRPDERIAGFSEWFGKFFAPLYADSSFSGRDRARLDEALAAMEELPEAFGGWQFAQVLTNGHSSFVAIDWGNLGAYWPLHDLAAAICSLDKFAEGATTQLRGPLIDAFTSGQGLDEAEQLRLELWLDLWGCFGRAAALHAQTSS